MRARSALFTLFGDVVRPSGGEAWLATLTTCMGALGFTPEATRTALHRMAAEGWVGPRRVGRYAAYRLTRRGVDRLEEAAARIYRLRAADWDGRWRMLVLPRRPGEDRNGLTRALSWMGFGRLTGELWVSPHDHGERLTALLDEHDLAAAHRFTTAADDADPIRDAAVVAEAWDLAELHAAQRAFCERWAGEPAPTEPEAAFRMRIQLVHHWRSFLFLDPGLPAPLLPDDWLGDEAARHFAELYTSLSDAAWSYYDAAADSAPPGAAPLPHRTDRSPLTPGLPVPS